MLGRAIFGNPWLFTDRSDVSKEEKLEALVELAYEFEKLSPPKSFAILKKHIKAFVNDFPGAAELRAKLMEAESAKDLEACLP
jgi:tRNA-dihydrouridine synthase